jgi:hypothetical protein
MYDNVTHGHIHPLNLSVRRIEVLVAVLAAIVALDIALVYAEQPGGPWNPTLDRISSVAWTGDGTVLSSGAGFAAHPASHVRLWLQLTNCLMGCATVDFTSVVASPSSFTVVNVSLPTIAPGATGNLTAIVETPSGSYTGPLTLSLA